MALFVSNHFHSFIVGKLRGKRTWILENTYPLPILQETKGILSHSVQQLQYLWFFSSALPPSPLFWLFISIPQIIAARSYAQKFRLPRTRWTILTNRGSKRGKRIFSRGRDWNRISRPWRFHHVWTDFFDTMLTLPCTEIFSFSYLSSLWLMLLIFIFFHFCLGSEVNQNWHKHTEFMRRTQEWIANNQATLCSRERLRRRMNKQFGEENKYDQKYYLTR